MEEFSYHNIFDTKGIEYLVIISFFIILIPFWLLLNREVDVTKRLKKVLQFLSPARLVIPQGIFYSKHHSWVFLEKNGVAKMGIDDLLLKITGIVNIRFLKNREEMIRKGDLVAEVFQQGKTLQLYAPISGKILYSNTELNDNQALLMKETFGKGWVYSIKPSNWLEDVSDCYLAEDATLWFNQEFDRYKDFLAAQSQRAGMIVLQEGGELVEGSLSALPNESWNAFQKEFLKSELPARMRQQTGSEIK